MAFVEPSALTTVWQLRLGPTLLSPEAACKGYLGSILTGVLKNGAQWTLWIAEILWLCSVATSGNQPCVQCTKCLHRVFVTTSEHNTHTTIKALYSISYHLPPPPLCCGSTCGSMAVETHLLGGGAVCFMAFAGRVCCTGNLWRLVWGFWLPCCHAKQLYNCTLCVWGPWVTGCKSELVQLLRRLKLHGQNHTKCTQFGPCKKIVFHGRCFLKTEY